ncbi:MAG: hypothetical protein P8X96_22125 [Desulfobacteraceae bacterium]
MKIGTSVKLISFNGTIEAESDCLPSENYWKLIGYKGQIVQAPDIKGIYAPFSEEPRLLVQFAENVKAFGSECHNKVENSLWILESDLSEI